MTFIKIFHDKVAAADQQLETTRANCAGMDRSVGKYFTVSWKYFVLIIQSFLKIFQRFLKIFHPFLSVASALDSLLSSPSLTVVCADKFDSDCSSLTESSSQLVSWLFKLTSLASANLEDSAIASLSAQILTGISEVTIISTEQSGIITACMSTIQFTVFLYVSQISLIESSKLEIAGALTFPGILLHFE